MLVFRCWERSHVQAALTRPVSTCPPSPFPPGPAVSRHTGKEKSGGYGWSWFCPFQPECRIDFSSLFHWKIFHQRVESRSNLSQAFIFFFRLNIGGGSFHQEWFTLKNDPTTLFVSACFSFRNSISWYLVLNTLAPFFTCSSVSTCVAQYLSC